MELMEKTTWSSIMHIATIKEPDIDMFGLLRAVSNRKLVMANT